MQLTTSVGADAYVICRMIAIGVRQKQGKMLLVRIEKKKLNKKNNNDNNNNNNNNNN